jgi:hypothetical protein
MTNSPDLDVRRNLDDQRTLPFQKAALRDTVTLMSSNGRTTDCQSENAGSIPAIPAIKLNMNSQDEQYSDEETKRRVESTLRGAFDGPPTPLKNTPKKSGAERSLKRRSNDASEKPAQSENYSPASRG